MGPRGGLAYDGAVRSEGSSTVIREPADLRPMPFGNARVHSISNPLIEPIWGGLRVLAHVTDGGAVIRDPDGLEVEALPRLLTMIAANAQASEVVIDGHLVEGPLRDTTGVRVSTTGDSIRSAGEIGRHFLLGGLASPKRDVIAEKEAAAASAAAASGDVAFIATDLLWLDGEPLLDVPLLERKRLLESVLSDDERVRRTVAVRPPVEMWHAQWLSLGFREMAIKGANSRYTPGEPNPEWAITMIRRR